MSDCRVPMPVYSKPKDLAKTEEIVEKEEDIPPIPEGWIVMSLPNSCISIDTSDTMMSPLDTRIRLKVNVEANFNWQIYQGKSLDKMQGLKDVLILVKDMD